MKLYYLQATGIPFPKTEGDKYSLVEYEVEDSDQITLCGACGVFRMTYVKECFYCNYQKTKNLPIDYENTNCQNCNKEMKREKGHTWNIVCLSCQEA